MSESEKPVDGKEADAAAGWLGGVYSATLAGLERLANERREKVDAMQDAEHAASMLDYAERKEARAEWREERAEVRAFRARVMENDERHLVLLQRIAEALEGMLPR